MSSPTVTNWSWRRSLPQFVALGILMGLSSWILPTERASGAMAVGAFAYVAYSLTSRMVLARQHRLGVRAFRSGRYDEALEHYDRSIAFFERHPWIDRYRSVTMMSPSAWSYREMGMLNRAFAMAQNGDHEQAIAAYKEVLSDYPENEMAEQALRMMTPPEDANNAHQTKR